MTPEGSPGAHAGHCDSRRCLTPSSLEDRPLPPAVCLEVAVFDRSTDCPDRTVRLVHEDALLRLTDSDERNQNTLDDLAKRRLDAPTRRPPAHYAGSSHLRYRALIFARDVVHEG